MKIVPKVILMILALAVFFVPSVAAAGDKPAEIRFGVASIGTGGRPVTRFGGWLAITAANGALEAEFAKEGIKVKYTYFAGGGPALNEALANHQLDFGWEGDLPGLVAKAGGLKTKLILAAARFGTSYLAVPAGSSANSIKDLKGKRIALSKGTAGQLSFYKFLAANGLSENDFKLINMNSYDGNAALVSNHIDAQWGGTDFVPYVDRGAVRIIASTKGDRKAASLNHILVTEEFATKYPHVVQRVVNVLLKSAAWAADEANRSKAYLIFTKSGQPLSVWKAEYDGVALRDRDSPLFDEFYRVHYKRQLKRARDLKLVRKDFDIDSWIDATYLNRGLKELKLENVWREFDAEGNPKGRGAR